MRANTEEVPVKYGVYMASTEETSPLADVARAAEERGFDSIWIPEHVHIPVDRKTPYPFSPDGALPGTHFRLPDPFVQLATVASVTSEIKLGMGICLVTEHEPIAMAKAAASLDYVSDGRLLFGIGAGWMAEEMEPLGVRFKDRWKVAEQRVRAMKVLWTEDEAEYHSEFVDIPKTYLYPKPVQDPHPPVYIGATSRWARQRVAAWAEGWLPNRPDPDFLESGIREIREMAGAAGRDPEAIQTSLFGVKPELVEENPALLDAFERIGIERVILILPLDRIDVVIAALDRLTKLVPVRA